MVIVGRRHAGERELRVEVRRETIGGNERG